LAAAHEGDQADDSRRAINMYLSPYGLNAQCPRILAAMIGESDWGIHDLSRVELGAGGLPRFNMPMELVACVVESVAFF
jgi:hypothetical protein